MCEGCHFNTQKATRKFFHVNGGVKKQEWQTLITKQTRPLYFFPSLANEQRDVEIEKGQQHIRKE